MKTLILLGLLVSGPLHARYSAIDEGACSQKVATTGLNIEEASCVGKDCSCYTKVFREQIDGLAKKRKEQVSIGLEKTYIDAATSQMRDLLDIDLLSSIKKGALSG
ncbi:MAG: hypothetical protein KC478_17925, partial [Bacteriovoracaceae bacterium]|nr:hypothetical protein [Bacteriovoracaceae bacterium]